MKKYLSEIKRHLMTAISYMLPLVVASGLLIAIGNLMGGENVSNLSDLTFASSLTTLGVFGMGLLPSFIAGYISYSIADRPGIAPGFLMGQIASFLGAGFLGGIIGGFVAGYVSLLILTYVKVPHWAIALMPMMIVPTLASIIGGFLMFFVLGTPLTLMSSGLTNFIVNLDQSQKTVYGFIIGFVGCLDYGGAISKVPNLICDGLLLEGITGPEGIKVLAAMVPPIGVTFALIISRVIHKRIFTNQEVEAIKVAFPMGICMISEGVIPIAMNDLLRTVVATSIGCGVTGAISFTFGNGSPVPSGGVFVIPAMDKPLVAVVALLVGSLVTALILVVLKKRLTDEEVDAYADDVEEDIDLSGLSFE